MYMNVRETAVFMLILIAISITGCITDSQLSTDHEDYDGTGIAHESRQGMDTIIIIEIIGPERSTKTALDLAYIEINRIESLMSIFSPDSEISRLNKAGYIDNVSPDLPRRRF